MAEETTESEVTETTEEKAPRVTRGTILAELESLGYTGPTSYSKSKLADIRDQVAAGTYEGKGAPGTD